MEKINILERKLEGIEVEVDGNIDYDGFSIGLKLMKADER